MATSTIPATIDALVALFTASLSDVDVHDGPAVVSNRADHLSVGYAGRDNPEAVSWEQTAAGIQRGAHPRDEVFFVNCVINSGSGDAVMSTRRTRAFAILGQVETSLRADPSLGGVVMTAQVADGSLLQDLDENGMFAGLVFRIRCKSRI